ncbi:RNA polymerase sigma factor [Kitasatospora misakiensis]|uniref:RNA polymerase sigma factor n=1 Tax=Kitasatospora misakiensis TaxID=67330 RepID=A0ABW0WZE4_9ACTN
MGTDEERFHVAYDTCYAPVFRYAARRVAADAVEDIVAEAFVVAWRRRRDLPETPLPWLYAIARRTIANHERGRRRGSRLLAALLPAGRVHAQEAPGIANVHLRWAIGQLPERDREVLRLVAWEGLSVSETAAVMGCTAATASVRLHRARGRLRRLLDEPEAPARGAQRPQSHEATSEV